MFFKLQVEISKFNLKILKSISYRFDLCLKHLVPVKVFLKLIFF